MPPRLEDFINALQEIFKEAQQQNQPFIDVKAGELHRRVGGYPSRNHRMPLCCRAMRRIMQPGDEILDEPRSGMGATLTIRYRLPRNI